MAAALGRKQMSSISAGLGISVDAMPLVYTQNTASPKVSQNPDNPSRYTIGPC
jgi:hypothetical protein